MRSEVKAYERWDRRRHLCIYFQLLRRQSRDRERAKFEKTFGRTWKEKRSRELPKDRRTNETPSSTAERGGRDGEERMREGRSASFSFSFDLFPFDGIGGWERGAMGREVRKREWERTDGVRVDFKIRAWRFVYLKRSAAASAAVATGSND